MPLAIVPGFVRMKNTSLPPATITQLNSDLDYGVQFWEACLAACAPAISEICVVGPQFLWLPLLSLAEIEHIEKVSDSRHVRWYIRIVIVKPRIRQIVSAPI